MPVEKLDQGFVAQVLDLLVGARTAARIYQEHRRLALSLNVCGAPDRRGLAEVQPRSSWRQAPLHCAREEVGERAREPPADGAALMVKFESREILPLFPTFVWKTDLKPGEFQPLNRQILEALVGLEHRVCCGG